jgi:biotin carboxylase
MDENRPTTILCLASYFKGTTVLETCRDEGCHVLLVTREKIAHKDWPMSAVDERLFMLDLSKMPDMRHAIGYLARSRKIDRIIPLDDYDVLTAAAIREHTRIPGMGQTTARRFRDKLAMRYQAQSKGLLVPEFVPVLNYDDLRDFMNRIPAPWVLKPRTEAGAMGIKLIHNQEELWRWLDNLGDEQSYFLLEQYISGDVFHVDSIVWDEKVVFAEPNAYWQPPINVAHEGGVFVTRTMSRRSKDAKALLSMNKKLVKALGMIRGVTHTEFIRGTEDGRLYFLETAARVGGANIAEFVEAATGINLWREWARLEIAAARGKTYQLPEVRQDYAGILICLAKQEYPDTAAYTDPEIVWRLHGKANHAGLILAADNTERIEELLGQYHSRFINDYLAVAPPLDKAPQ